jgi:signal recognition particle receptor subunit beta
MLSITHSEIEVIMSLVNYAKKEIICKVVYYGPGRSGKTTNLQYIFSKIPIEKRGEMTSLATEMDRTLFFDFLPFDVGKIGNFNAKFQLYTVPGQVYIDSTRKLVLQGADGVVFGLGLVIAATAGTTTFESSPGVGLFARASLSPSEGTVLPATSLLVTRKRK